MVMWKNKLFLSDFWAKAWSVSIRTKIMGIVTLCILCFALAMVWFAERDMSTSLRRELVERGITIGTGLASQSRDLILTDNRYVLFTLIKEQYASQEDIAYIFVTGDDGSVLVHTFEEGFPADLLGINQLGIGEPYRIQLLQTEAGRIQDVAVPILADQSVVARLGMLESAIHTTVNEYITNIVLWTALILVLGFVVAYGLASFLTKPLSQLSEAARAIGKGDFKWKAPPWAKDEVGSLGTAFNEMSDELKHKEEMRERLLAKVISAQEDERKRISRELHDETGQTLTSMLVSLKIAEDSADSPQTRKNITKLRALTSQALERVHDMATELRPSILDDIGLVAAVRRYLNEYSKKIGMRVDSHISGFDGCLLSPEIEITVYRIIQEALTNIVKHAEASRVSVIMRLVDSSLTAIIEDDGKGFDTEAPTISSNGKNLGLFGMNERASLVGGTLTIESEPKSGTSVFLCVPLDLSGEASDERDNGSVSR
jgi:signal transduction histidine kinase